MDAVFQAVLGEPKALADMLSAQARLAGARMTKDELVEAIHWLYVGDTPLHLAGAGLRLEAAKLLLAAGADANAANRRSATALHYTCDPRPAGGPDASAQVAVIRALIDAGARVDAATMDGVTPLHRAVRARSPAAVRALLEHGATVRAMSKQGSTPLHIAMTSNGAGGTAGSQDQQIEIIELLLAAGAALSDKDGAGKPAIDRLKSPVVRAHFARAGLSNG